MFSVKYDFDIVIVGSGLVGGCLALALQDSGLKIAIIDEQTWEQRKQSASGHRALALSLGSTMFLEGLGIWSLAQDYAVAIKDIHVSNQGHFGKTRISSSKEGVAALGFVITARDLEKHVAHSLTESSVTEFEACSLKGLMSSSEQISISVAEKNRDTHNFSARLLVGADGGQSTVRKLLEIDQYQQRYEQTAIVTKVKPELSPHHVAYERFTNSGPLAFLPTLNECCSVVWTCTTEEAEELLNASEEKFLAELQRCFGYRLGYISMVAPVKSFPLSLIKAQQITKGRAVIIGNAVHQLHPVAGQGLNLGLRDVADLVQLLIAQAASGNDIGAGNLLSDYAEKRYRDHQQVIKFTDGLVKLFSNSNPWLALSRNTGMVLLDHLKPAKGILVKRAMGVSVAKKFDSRKSY